MTHRSAESSSLSRDVRRVGLLSFGLLPLYVVLVGCALWLGTHAGEADDRADAATAQLGAADEKVLDFAAQLTAACTAGLIHGPVCEDAADAIETAPPDSPVVVDLTDEVTAIVADRIEACINSGACVGADGQDGAPGATGPPGPYGPAGEDGASPTSDELVAAVVTACETEVDCQVTPDEIAQAVAAYCAQASAPCGVRWTEEQIYRIANRATVDYLFGRPIRCPSLNEIIEKYGRDQPFDCFVSSG